MNQRQGTPADDRIGVAARSVTSRYDRRESAASQQHWMRELTLLAIRAEGPGTLDSLCAVLGRATSARGAVLWKAVDAGEHPAIPSVLALWLEDSVPLVSCWEVGPDGLTAQAFRDRSLAIPADAGQLAAERQLLFHLPVTAALPVDYADGRLGALTLLGHRELTGEVFDVAAALVEVLPDLCRTVRERQTLALVHVCNSILHEADMESPGQLLPRNRLREHLVRICDAVAQALQCIEVSVFLSDPSASPGMFPLFARSSSPPGAEGPQDHHYLGGGTPQERVSYDGEPLMEVPLLSGEWVIGMIRCRGAHGPPYHFTSLDLPLLRPIAAQLAQYWRNWLHGLAISEENDSWRRLAAGVTSFNRLMSEALRGNAGPDSRRDQLVSAAAVEMVRTVVPESTGAAEIRALPEQGSAPRLVEVGDVERQASPGAGDPRRTLAERVYTSRCQQWTADPDGWLLCTPIQVGDMVYGVLKGFGPAPEPPANSAQVYEIVSDQLGLYRHLQRTLGRLEEARRSLQNSLRNQADTMEDLKHQLVSPLRTATDRTDLVIRTGRFDSRAEAQLKAVRGLCRKASRVALSAGVFAALSKGERPVAKCELLGAGDLLRLIIAAADDTQVLSHPKQGITLDVGRESVRELGRRLVEVDSSFLQQCLGNVLDNASKYSYPNTRVQISAAISADWLSLIVTNTGIPLDPADTTRCLTRNWRGAAARNATGEGSGIGLWIVDHLMRLMKGHVEVEAAGDMTVVRLLLPIA
jgi:signal transduction histidine kinase